MVRLSDEQLKAIEEGRFKAATERQKGAVQSAIAENPDLITADVPDALRERYGIAVSPLHVTYRDGSYTDGQNIRPEDILQRYAQENYHERQGGAYGVFDGWVLDAIFRVGAHGQT